MSFRLAIFCLAGYYILTANDNALPEYQAVVMQQEDPYSWLPGCSIECAFTTDECVASSELTPDGSLKYEALNTWDKDTTTAWVEGKRGAGTGEFLEYTLITGGDGPKLTQLTISNGYRKNSELWRQNGRVRKLRLDVNGKPRCLIKLKDAFNAQVLQIDPIPLSEQATVLRLTILEVYPGSKYDDTAITEVRWDGIGHH